MARTLFLLMLLSWSLAQPVFNRKPRAGEVYYLFEVPYEVSRLTPTNGVWDFRGLPINRDNYERHIFLAPDSAHQAPDYITYNLIDSITTTKGHAEFVFQRWNNANVYLNVTDSVLSEQYQDFFSVSFECSPLFPLYFYSVSVGFTSSSYNSSCYYGLMFPFYKGLSYFKVSRSGKLLTDFATYNDVLLAEKRHGYTDINGTTFNMTTVYFFDTSYAMPIFIGHSVEKITYVTDLPPDTEPYLDTIIYYKEARLFDPAYYVSNVSLRKSLEEVKIHPNPAKDVLYLDLPRKATYKIFDLQGRSINVVRKDNRLDISSLVPGMYFIRIRHGEEQVVKKFVKH